MGALLEVINRQFAELVHLLAFDPALLAAPEMVFRLTLMAMLMLASAFFSSAETALFSLSQLELRELRHSGYRAADTIHALLDQPRRLIISLLCGNELINVAATANMVAILLALYPPEEVLVINLFVMVPLLLLFGEVTPKTIAVTNPLLVSTRISARPMNAWVRLITPLRWLVRQASERITTLLVGEERAPANILQVDEFRTLVEEVVERGEMHAMERALIDNILAAGSAEVLQIMLPRTRVAFLDGDLPMTELLAEVRRHRHRQFPVYRGNRDQVVGMLRVEDLATRFLDGGDPAAIRLEELLHPVAAVPQTSKVDDLFAFFIQEESRAAVVVDEFGGVQGLVTLGDVIGFVFGHTVREDAPDQAVTETEDGAWEVDGGLKLGKFNSLLRREGGQARMTTVAGLMLQRLNRRPVEGDTVDLDGVTLRIVAMAGLRIARVRVEPAGYAGRLSQAAQPAGHIESTGREGQEDA